MNVGSKIYHYTDFNSLKGIIKYGELWLFSTKGMNDPEEMAPYIDMFKEYLIEIHPNPTESNRFKIEDWFNKNRNVFVSPAYIMAFSEREDDAAQWERYALRGKGVCIEFDADQLGLIAKANDMELEPIIYDNGSEDGIFDEKLIEQMLEYMESQTLPYGYDTDKGFFQDIIAKACMYKGRFYSSEMEYRLALPAPILEKDRKKLKYLVKEDEIKEYYPLNWKQEADSQGIKYNDIVKKIIVGNKSPQDFYTLKNYMHNTNNAWASDLIKQSLCPMR